MTKIDISKFARKGWSWDRRYEVGGVRIPTASRNAQKSAASLPEFAAEESPCATFSGERPQYHVARLPDGRRFIVDTQGFDYARYVAQLPSRRTAKKRARK